MLDHDGNYGEELMERVPAMTGAETRGPASDLMIRRRIEHMRELKRLRELLDDPDFDDLS